MICQLIWRVDRLVGMREVVRIRGVQNRTNSIEKLQTKPTQIETAKNRISFGCNQIIYLLNRMVWFAVFILPTEPNQTKLQHK